MIEQGEASYYRPTASFEPQKENRLENFSQTSNSG